MEPAYPIADTISLENRLISVKEHEQLGGPGVRYSYEQVHYDDEGYQEVLKTTPDFMTFWKSGSGKIVIINAAFQGHNTHNMKQKFTKN